MHTNGAWRVGIGCIGAILTWQERESTLSSGMQCSSLQALRSSYLRKVQDESLRRRNIGGFSFHSTCPLLGNIFNQHLPLSKLPRNLTTPVMVPEPLSRTPIHVFGVTRVGYARISKLFALSKMSVAHSGRMAKAVGRSILRACKMLQL